MVFAFIFFFIRCSICFLLFPDLGFIPYGIKIFLKFLQRFPFSFRLFIYKNIPVYIDSGLFISQKDIIGIASSQQIHRFINDQVLIMHPVIQTHKIRDWIIYSNFYILMCCQRLKHRTLFQKELLIDPIDQYLYLHTSFCRCIQCRNDLRTTVIRT